MEARQFEIRQEMEQKLTKIQEQTYKRYQKDVQLMQEEYKRKLDQEVQRYISSHSSTLGTGSTQTMMISKYQSINQRRS